jgi:hypothetical protein
MYLHEFKLRLENRLTYSHILKVISQKYQCRIRKGCKIVKRKNGKENKAIKQEGDERENKRRETE